MLRKIRQMLKSQEGFTLVELMIVVVILGILAGIGVQQYGNIQERAKKAANEANIKIILSAANMFLMAETNLEPLVKEPSNGKNRIQVLVDQGYLEDEPKTPDGGEYTLDILAKEPTEEDKGYKRDVTGKYWLKVEEKVDSL